MFSFSSLFLFSPFTFVANMIFKVFIFIFYAIFLRNMYYVWNASSRQLNLLYIQNTYRMIPHNNKACIASCLTS